MGSANNRGTTTMMMENPFAYVSLVMAGLEIVPLLAIKPAIIEESACWGTLL